MSAVHLHLMLNHLPVVGTGFTLALFLWSLWRRQQVPLRISLGFFSVVALFSIIAYVTGEPAEETMKGHHEIVHDLIEQHEQIAAVALTLSLANGIATTLALWVNRKREAISRSWIVSILVLAVATQVFMVWTGYLGGQARHPEVRTERGTPH